MAEHSIGIIVAHLELAPNYVHFALSSPGSIDDSKSISAKHQGPCPLPLSGNQSRIRFDQGRVRVDVTAASMDLFADVGRGSPSRSFEQHVLKQMRQTST